MAAGQGSQTAMKSLVFKITGNYLHLCECVKVSAGGHRGQKRAFRMAELQAAVSCPV